MFNFFIYICIYLFLPYLIQKRCSILQIKLNLVPFTIDHWFLFVITSYQFLVHHSRIIPRNRVNGILLEWFKHVPFFVLIIRKFAQMLKLVDYILHSVLCRPRCIDKGNPLGICTHAHFCVTTVQIDDWVVINTVT